jgi:DNA-binding response OmpR family regulator
VNQILVVDGEPDMAATYERLLRRSGHRVVLAATRADGMQFLERLPPRLVILDLRLPDGDGLDVIRAAGRLAAAPAVIAITAFASRAARQSALDAGARAFLAKPFAIDEFSNLVERLIQHPAVSTLT